MGANCSFVWRKAEGSFMHKFVGILLVCCFMFLCAAWAEDEVVDEFVSPADVFREAVSGSMWYAKIMALGIVVVAIAALISMRLPMLDDLRHSMWERMAATTVSMAAGLRGSASDRIERMIEGAPSYGKTIKRLREKLGVEDDDPT
jgi:hypothetical protein